MKRLVTAVFLLLLALGADLPAYAPGTEWNALNDETMSLLGQRLFDQGIVVANNALRVAEKTRGPNSATVAVSLNNLARLYDAQGDYARAEALYQRSMALRVNTLGAGHPDVAKSLSNLAVLYAAQGQYAQAETYYHRSLAIMEQAVGQNHSDVGRILNNIAKLYHDLGQYELSEQTYNRALGILEKTLGPNDPDIATSLDCLAALYLETGREKASRELEKRADAIRGFKREKQMNFDARQLLAQSLRSRMTSEL